MTGQQVILVPGAWMNGSVWAPVAAHLTEHGLTVQAPTLLGLEPGADRTAPAAIRLAEHVAQLRALVEKTAGPVVLVGHSYSSLVTAQVADRLPERIAGLIHLGGFLPVDGRSLLDAWGDSEEERAAETAQIRRDGDLWMPPTVEMLAGEPDLDAAAREKLGRSFVPHPGRTVLDPAVMTAPVAQQPTTYVALSPHDCADAWAQAPAPAREAARWRRRHLATGHFAMVSQPQAVADLIAEEVAARPA